jgi:Tol biopolymer transport system component
LLRWIRHVVIFGIGWLIIFTIPHANATPSPQTDLLQGPLVVTPTPQQDGFLLIDLETGVQRHLSFGPGNHYLGGFSPDGCELVFIWEQQPGYGDLYATRIDGSNLRRLLDLGPTGALSYRAWEPEWSPDGSKIVFTLIRYYDPPDQEPYRTSHIAWVTPNGGSPEFYSNSGTESQPRWSSDGQRLVYVSNQPVITETPTPEAEDSAVGDIEGKPELWMVNADGQNKFRLTSFANNAVYNPRWSPTNFFIAFVFQVMPNFHQLMVIPADGAAPATMVNEQAGTILDFVWQPTGDTLIAAIQNFGDESRNVLWRLPFEQTGNPPPTPLINEPMSFYHDYPRFSADGRWVAFRAAYELSVYDVVLNTLQTFGPETKNNNPPLWSPIGFQGEATCLQN